MSTSRNDRECLSPHIPGSPARIYSYVLKAQVVQIEMWLVTILSHYFNAIFEQNNLFKSGVPSDTTCHLQCAPDNLRMSWDLQNRPATYGNTTELPLNNFQSHISKAMGEIH